jgi:hypothetical protein
VLDDANPELRVCRGQRWPARRRSMLDQDWSLWRMAVHDDGGVELFSFPMADIEDS